MLREGDSLRDYEIRSVIGQGGFGVVYRGRHQELDIDVAIKEYFPQELSVRQDRRVLPSRPEFQVSFEDGLVRFLKEAQQLEKFRDCPNIVTCRDIFRANGTAYTVMEYVSGLPLSVLLEQRESLGEPLTEQELLELILPLLKGLQIVHKSGVCHRDIKPSNILVRRADAAPILIDFGAAKHEISKHTKSFAPYTDGYAALEQVGEGEIGPWTDIYGLGAVMWRIVAGGNPPFSPPTPLTIQKRAFALMHGREDPLPSACKIGKGRFSERVLETIDECLVPNVDSRVQNCDELLERLDESPGKSLEAPNPSVTLEKENQYVSNQTRTEYSKKRYNWTTKKPLLLTLGSIGLLLIISIFAVIHASRTDATVAYSQGNKYYYGQGVTKNYQEAIMWYRKAADQGHALSQLMLGYIYDSGEGVRENDQEAVRWYKLAAEQGNVEAQHSLGYMHANGLGIPKNDQEAVKWYRLAAEQGHAEAQYSLGRHYANDRSIGRSYVEAVKWYRLAAEQGHAEAQYSLGWHYASRAGVIQNYAEAVKWYRLAAEQGHAEAQYSLGRHYANGRGIGRSYVEAVKWYRLAAEQGHAEAQYSLGWYYANGRSIGRSYVEAVKWYRLAAEQGHAEAQYNLSLYYSNGMGVARNKAEAYAWAMLSSEQGNKKAANRVNSLRKLMTYAQVVEARRLISIRR